MGNLLSDRTTDRMLNAVNFVEGMAAPVHARSNRRVRSSGGGGTSNFVLKITAVTNLSTYTANIINNRTDQTVIETGVTLKALDHDAGLFPVTAILTCTLDEDNDLYEPTNYSVFYGS